MVAARKIDGDDRHISLFWSDRSEQSTTCASCHARHDATSTCEVTFDDCLGAVRSGDHSRPGRAVVRVALIEQARLKMVFMAVGGRQARWTWPCSTRRTRSQFGSV